MRFSRLWLGLLAAWLLPGLAKAAELAAEQHGTAAAAAAPGQDPAAKAAASKGKCGLSLARVT